MRDPFYEPSKSEQIDLSKFTNEQLKRFAEINKEHCKMNADILSRISSDAVNVEFEILKVDRPKLDPLDYIDNPIDDIMSHIRKALIEADNNYIKSNMIIIDQDLAITNHLLVPHYNYDGKIINYSECNPMMFGRAVKYQKNLTKDLAANFIITQGQDTDRVKALEEENARLREQLNKIKELLGI